jgi:SAM-dependent methyltransferase
MTGFRILKWLDLTNWKSVAIYDHPLVDVQACPIDGATMSPVVNIESDTLKESIGIGCCPACGLVGYTNRPVDAAVGEYYRSTWMGESDEQALAAAWQVEADLSLHYGKHEVLDARLKMVSELPIDKSRPVLEVGCGYGRTVQELKRAGYADIHAIESCPARAKATHEVYSVPVDTGDFLQSNGDNYALIASHHVLEHCTDPDAFIAKAASMQDVGGCLCLSVPNFFGEPSMGVVFFWPHLWSFMPATLYGLLAKHGYTVCAQHDCGPSETYLIAQKQHRQPGTPNAFDPVPLVVEKLRRGLGLKQAGPAEMTWQRDGDGAVWKSADYLSVAHDSPFPRRAVVEPLLDDEEGAPIEIRFGGRVELCQK